MRRYRPNTFKISRFNNGWKCHAEGMVLTPHRLDPEEVNFTAYGKLRFLTYVRAVFGLRKKARAMRAKGNERRVKFWPDTFEDYLKS